MGRLTTPYRWMTGSAVVALLVTYCAWLVYTDAPAYQLLVRLYIDKYFLKRTLREWGILAPVLFMLLSRGPRVDGCRCSQMQHRWYRLAACPRSTPKSGHRE